MAILKAKLNVEQRFVVLSNFRRQLRLDWRMEFPDVEGTLSFPAGVELRLPFVSPVEFFLHFR